MNFACSEVVIAGNAVSIRAGDSSQLDFDVQADDCRSDFAVSAGDR
jgi:hypothetical protein